MERLIDIDLVRISYKKDSIGQQVEESVITNSLVGKMYSVTRLEWMNASQLGLQPEMTVKLANEEDFSGETYADVKGVRYTIYRTYLTNDGGIELYLRKDTGPNL